jgi:hypothetical protein
MHPRIQQKRATPLFLIVLGFVSLGLLPKTQAVSPAPDGGYPGGNTAEGQNALFSLTTGSSNTGTGYKALFSNTSGHDNVASGSQALFRNTTGIYNTANGLQALYKNTTGTNNTAKGESALYSNSTGDNNTANDESALYSNTTGSNNTANGYEALVFSTTSGDNTANGYQALYSNMTGNLNTANGDAALYSKVTGTNNTATGVGALNNNTTGISNIALDLLSGSNLTTGNFNIDIGNAGIAGESNTIRIGSGQSATYIAGIYGATASGGVAVYINSAGQLGTMASSARFKQNIHDMGAASEVLLVLHLVTFQYKPELDPKGIAQFGLVAEDVEKVNPALVSRDTDGKPYTVRYEAVNAMLLNEFLKEHKTVQEQGAVIAHQQKQIEALTAGLEKVSDQLEVSKPAPQTVLNNH